MFGGGGGLNPRKMKQMMEQMGLEIKDIDAEEVIIRTEDTEYVFTDADVQRMDMQGEYTYQIVGEPDERDREGGDAAASDTAADAGSESIPDADVEIVAQRAEVTEDDARAALEATDGDLAAAVERLE
jgi:nascent polypeptide-associated complex subunit alpha